jgi:hypothetical protein
VTCTAPYPRLGQERKPNHNLGSREAAPRSERVGTERSGGGQESIYCNLDTRHYLNLPGPLAPRTATTNAFCFGLAALRG